MYSIIVITLSASPKHFLSRVSLHYRLLIQTAFLTVSVVTMTFCVHSAGVGRTGCFIVIDSMLERMRHEKIIDIYGHVTCLRAQRNYMVQVRYVYQKHCMILKMEFEEKIMAVLGDWSM